MGEASAIILRGFSTNLQRLNGKYVMSEESNGHPTFVRKGPKGEHFMYYSDEPSFEGWWLGPVVNGDEVWARNPNKTKMPPRSGWYEPWDSNKPNPSISLVMVEDAGAKPVANANGQKRPIPIGNDKPIKMLKTVHTVSTKTDEEMQELYTKVNNTLIELEPTVENAEGLVEKLKDSGVMFMCEVVDHMTPDEILELKKTADDAGKQCQEEVQKIRKSLDEARKENDQCRGLGDKYTETKSKIDAISKKLQEFNKEIQRIAGDVTRGSQKAVQKKKQEEQVKLMEEKKKKVEEAQKSQRVALQKVHAFQMLLKPTKAAIKDMTSVTEMRDSEALLMAMNDEINKDLSLCTGSSQNSLRNFMSSTKPLIKMLQDKRRDIFLNDAAKVDELGTIVACGIQAFMEKEKLDEAATFSRIAQTESEMTEAHLTDFAKTIDLGEKYTTALCSSLFARALAAASVGCEKQKEKLTQDDFFMHVARSLYCTTSQVVLEESESTENKHKVELGEIVEVIEGPFGEPLKVKCKTMEGKSGQLPFKVLQRMSTQFSVVQETVLTDKHQLKGFAVVMRLRPGMKIVALKAPQVDPTTKLLRLHVETKGEDDQLVRGYVTVKGNRGAQLLKQEAASSTDFGAAPVTAKEVASDEWEKMIAEHTESLTSELTKGIEEISSLQGDCEKKCMALEALADGWTEEVLEETSAAAIAAWEHIDQLIQSLAGKIVTRTKEIGNVSADDPGPLAAVKATMDNVHKQMLECKSAHVENTKRARAINKSLRVELDAAIKKRELAKEEAFINTCVTECIAKREVLGAMLNQVSVDPTDEKGLLALEETLKEAEEMVNSMRAWSDETRKECKSKTAQKMELTKNMAEFSSNLAKLNGARTTRKNSLPRLWSDIVDTGAILMAKALRDHMEMNQLSEEAFFTQLTKENNGVLNLAVLQKFLKELKVDLSDTITGRVYGKISPGASGNVSAQQFGFLTNCYYRVTKPTTLIDTLSIKGGNILHRLKINDSVRVIGVAEVDESSTTVRHRVIFEDKEGYVTIKGNQGSVFLEPQSFHFQVTKDTVLTNKFDMQAFSVVRRLKIGDVLRARSLPKEESKSGLWRLEVICLLPKDAACKTTEEDNSGFVTMKGNQGTTFLESISIDGMDLVMPGEGREDVTASEEKKDVVAETAPVAEKAPEEKKEVVAEEAPVERKKSKKAKVDKDVVMTDKPSEKDNDVVMT